MVVPTEEQLRALLRLGGSKDFEVFLDWLRGNMEANKEALITAAEETQLRKLQGECRALQSILDYAAHADEALRKMNSRKP